MRNKAKQAFEKLAEAYLIASNRSLEAQTFVQDQRIEHNYALSEYYFSKSNQEHSKKALKNDVKGLAER